MERVHALGPRAVAHLLFELADELDGQAVLERLLNRYDRLTPELLRATGGDRFPPRPLVEVSGTVRRRA